VTKRVLKIIVCQISSREKGGEQRIKASKPDEKKEELSTKRGANLEKPHGNQGIVGKTGVALCKKLL